MSGRAKSRSKGSRTDVLIGRAVIDLRRDLCAAWEKITSGRNVDRDGFREFFPPFTRYAERLLTVKVEELSRVPLKTVVAKVNGFWPDGRSEGTGLRTDVILRIAPKPPFQAGRKESQKLLELRLSNDQFFHEDRENHKLPDQFVQAAANVGIENDSKLFEALLTLPQRCLGDWFQHMLATWGTFRNASIGGKSADLCQGFSLVMVDWQVWKEFFNSAFSAISIHAENLLNERSLGEMERDARPSRGRLNHTWIDGMVEVLAVERRNREACKLLDERGVSLPPRVTWKGQNGHPTGSWVKAFEGRRSLVDSHLSKFRKRHGLR